MRKREFARKLTITIALVAACAAAGWAEAAAVPAPGSRPAGPQAGPQATTPAASAASAAHRPILPAPQQITYGAGMLPLRALTAIRFEGQAPVAEDLFAARELASWIKAASGTGVPVATARSAAPAPAAPAAVTFRRTTEPDPLPVPDETAGPDSREAYEIRVTPQGVAVKARSSAGLYYAAQTLRQMIEGQGPAAALPEAQIRDWPCYAYRGYMMDFSHSQLPTPDEVRSQIDFLARFKTNQYLFYSECSIELKGFPTLMSEARYTQAEVKAIIDYARERHIDVIPNMELFGHLHDLFRLERYSDLSNIPHGGELKADDPRIQPLLEDWIGQMARLFPSPFFHMGFDETWLIESEAAKLHADPGDLYLKRLKQVTAIIEKNGKRPWAYADMMEKFPKILASLPPGLTAFTWHYFPLDDALYDKIYAPFVANHTPTSLMTAVINWNWLVTDYDRSFLNADKLAAAGRKYHALGFYQSGWTDDTQNLTRPGRPAWAYSSVAAWQTAPVDRAGFFPAYASILYPPEIAGEAAGAFAAMARAETLLQDATSEETTPVFFENPFAAAALAKSDTKRQALHETRLACDEALAHILACQASGVEPTTFKSLEACERMVDFAALKHIYAREIADFWAELGPKPDKKEAFNLLFNEVSFKYHTRTSDMMDALSVIRDRFREAWLMEFAPFRLNIALAKFDIELAAWRMLQRRFQELVNNLDNGLPPLAEMAKGLW